MTLSKIDGLKGRFSGTKEQCLVFLDYAKKNNIPCSEIQEHADFLQRAQNSIALKMPHVQIGWGNKEWVQIDEYAIEVTFPHKKSFAVALLKFKM